MKKIALVSAVLLAGCVNTETVAVTSYTPSPADVSIATQVIAAKLRDPDSIQTRGVVGYRTGRGERVICGQYNSRNGFGGYGGFDTFYIRLTPQGTVAASWADDGGAGVASSACYDARDGTMNLPPA